MSKINYYNNLLKIADFNMVYLLLWQLKIHIVVQESVPPLPEAWATGLLPVPIKSPSEINVDSTFFASLMALKGIYPLFLECVERQVFLLYFLGSWRQFGRYSCQKICCVWYFSFTDWKIPSLLSVSSFLFFFVFLSWLSQWVQKSLLFTFP